MLPTLYYMTTSPLSMVNEALIKMFNINIKMVYIDLINGDQLKEDYLKICPRHVVPFLIDGDLKIAESRAIAKYLVAKYAEDDKLYPKDIVEQAKVDEMLFYEATSLYSLLHDILMCYYTDGPEAEINKRTETELEESLAYLDNLVSDKQFVVGDHLTLADMFIVTALGLAPSINYDLSKYTSIVKYIEHVLKSEPEFGEYHLINVRLLKESMPQ